MGFTVRPFFIVTQKKQIQMKAKKKTYGVQGYMEWQALIRCGKATLTVHFSGGSLTGYGVTPAEFTTENPMTQAIIENSDYFKKGKIFLMREVEGTGKFKEFVKGQHANEGNHKGGQEATASAISETALNPNGAPKTATPASDATDTVAETKEGTSVTLADEDENHSDEDEGVEEGIDPSDGTVTEDGKRIVEVTDIDDARDFLVDEFQIARSTLRSNVSVFRAAEEHNIVFNGIE